MGTPSFFTDYSLSVNEVFSGELSNDAVRPTITVRQEGGVGTEFATVNTDAVSFREDDRFLLFLYRMHDGSDFNTEGDHYYVFGVNRGAWKWSASDQAFLEPTDGDFEIAKLTLFDLQDRITRTPSAQSSVSDFDAREAILAARIASVEEELNDGEIDQAVYDQYVELFHDLYDNYAQVLSPDEQLACETSLAEAAVEGVPE